MAAERIYLARLVFPVEAIDYASFCAFYEQVRLYGDERINHERAEVTFLHPSGRGSRIDSLERLLMSAGMPYNLYCVVGMEKEVLHYWRPGMKETSTVEHLGQIALDDNFHSILSVRVACDEIVHAQAGLVFGR